MGGAAPNTSSIVSKNVENEYHDVSNKELFQKMLLPNISNSRGINCPSDHLPMLYKVKFGNSSANVLQMNLLAHGLASDGFLGGKSPSNYR